MASTDAVTRLLTTVYKIVVNRLHLVLKSIQNITNGDEDGMQVIEDGNLCV